VLTPATVTDARGMVLSALEEPDPVFIFEHAYLYSMEGELDELFSVIKKCLDQMTTDCNRVEAVIKVDYRKNVQKGMIDDKVKSVEKKLGRKVRT
jgi:pyruvate/2-oxoglutarate/acetoin dehydrogenase E1 component